jgi:hypothetical protein
MILAIFVILLAPFVGWWIGNITYQEEERETNRRRSLGYDR